MSAPTNHGMPDGYTHAVNHARTFFACNASVAWMPEAGQAAAVVSQVARQVWRVLCMCTASPRRELVHAENISIRCAWHRYGMPSRMGPGAGMPSKGSAHRAIVKGLPISASWQDLKVRPPGPGILQSRYVIFYLPLW